MLPADELMDVRCAGLQADEVIRSRCAAKKRRPRPLAEKEGRGEKWASNTP